MAENATSRALDTEWRSHRSDEHDWLEPSGLERAYSRLLEDGFCCGADDAPEELNRRWRAEIEGRAQRDGLRVHFEHAYDYPLVDPGLGSCFLLARLRLPDGSLPPDPNLALGQRLELRRQLEQWGETLASARRHHNRPN